MGYSIEFFKDIHQRCVNPSSHVKNYPSISYHVSWTLVFKMFVQFKPMLNVAVDGLVGAIIYIVLIIVLRVVDMKDLKQQLMKN